MAKKKTKQTKSNEVPRRPLTPEISPKIDYHRPLSSPYEFPLVTIIIGSKQYGIPAHLLQKHERFALSSLGSSTIIMYDVDEDIGHTVMHFLYTGGYQTIMSCLDEGASDLARECKRSILIYHASRAWDLSDLEILAKQNMQHLDEDLPVLEILRVVRDVFSSLPVDEPWLPGYIQGILQRLLKPEDPGFGLREFYDILGRDHRFDNAVMKIILEILSRCLFSMKSQPMKIPNGIISDESTRKRPFPEEFEPVPEEPEPEEPEPEEPEPEEPEPEEPEPEEPEPEEPEPVPGEPEPVPEMAPAGGDSEQWTTPQISADTDGSSVSDN